MTQQISSRLGGPRRERQVSCVTNVTDIGIELEADDVVF